MGSDILCLQGSYRIPTDEDNRHIVMRCHQCVDARFSDNFTVDTYLPDSSWFVCMGKHSVFCTNGPMIADKANTIKAGIQPFHHIKRFVPACDECRVPTQILRVQIAHI